MYENIVTLFNTEEQAETARIDLMKAGFSANDISVVSKRSFPNSASAFRESGLWQRLFGSDIGEHEASACRNIVETGGAVLTLRAISDDVPRAMEILKQHSLVHISDQGMDSSVTSKEAVPSKPITSDLGKQDVIRLAEEHLDVGKRQVEQGTKRIRRFVTERPVKEQVTLHEEHADVVRRAVSDPSYVKDIDWSDQTIEVLDTAEEAVVSKSARVAEEVVLGKTGSDRVETVRDTVRRQQVEVERIPAGVERTSASGSLVSVFYATDRFQISDPDSEVRYSSKRSPAGRVQYGKCEISIPNIHKKGHLESPSFIRFEFRPNLDKHIVLTSTKTLAEEKFYEDVKAAVAKSAKKEALVFVHGYNVTFEDAARRTGQFAYDLEFVGAPIFYSWPSSGKVLDYLLDETNVAWTMPHLRAFLSMLAEHSGAERIHIIAHSMGNRAVCEALRTLSYGADKEFKFTHVVLAAPDIDAETLVELSDALLKVSERVTLYQSSNDKALLASKKIHGYTRAGEPILIAPGIEAIDASAINTDFLGHSYFSNHWPLLADIHELLSTDHGAPRFGLVEVSHSNGSYFAFKS